MTISYPLTHPTGFTPSGFTLRACDAVGVSTSPFSGAQQVYRHTGQWWEADVQYPPLTRARAYQMMAFLDSLKGAYGTFLMGDPLHRAPLGTGAGTPKVRNTNAQRAETLQTQGWTPGSLVLKAGDLFQLGSGSTTRLHRNLTDATADGSGYVTLDIWPSLRAPALDNDPIVVLSPVGIWRLASNHRNYAEEFGQMYGVSITLREAL